ncbi:GNAT family N-acetyltransferase [Paenibacillus radicis (ex Gao et al. 2016)]|uniref:Acetyltransferase n=1 Tax=Paenibacillus radicis (ex Gao et al. 2016) TaxID=1737354 RepID=A0A917HUB5_9BACL|nr:GNAT family N-acetyltransferase [Paenibacillus radicis (ex Gao et al. 2016)]GGG90909.1 acetyltransferase [Paenibacillus radicis (ex Gao et al. 2016)]
MPIEIRELEEDYFDEGIELSQFAFQFTLTPEEKEKARERYKHEPAVRWGAFVDGNYAANLTLLTLHTYVGGKRFAMGGVAGVATWPEYRRQGLVAELLRTALLHMKEQGQTLSYLAPFAIGFYRKFGWELYTDNKRYKIEAALMPKRENYAGRIERLSDNIPLLNELYNVYARRYNGMLERTEAWWTNRVKRRKQGQTAVYYGADHTPQGYVLYEVKQKELKIHEIVALTEEAGRALWSYLGQHDSMIESAEAVVPIDDRLAFLLPNPRIKQEIEPYFMARIVDAEAFLSQYVFTDAQEGQPSTILIELTDEHAPWNTGVYKLDIQTDGTAKAAKIPQTETTTSSEKEPLRIRTDIGSLTAMLHSYMRPSELNQHGRVAGDAPAIRFLEARIPVKTPFLLDFF